MTTVSTFASLHMSISAAAVNAVFPNGAQKVFALNRLTLVRNDPRTQRVFALNRLTIVRAP